VELANFFLTHMPSYLKNAPVTFDHNGDGSSWWMYRERKDPEEGYGMKLGSNGGNTTIFHELAHGFTASSLESYNEFAEKESDASTNVEVARLIDALYHHILESNFLESLDSSEFPFAEEIEYGMSSVHEFVAPTHPRSEIGLTSR